jgi:two-component system, NarL family, nitrate/nitrite response regulator NarL
MRASLPTKTDGRLNGFSALATRSNAAALERGARNASIAFVSRSDRSDETRSAAKIAESSLGGSKSKLAMSAAPKRSRSEKQSDEADQLPLSGFKTIAIVDDHPLYRGGVAQALTETNRFRVVAEGGTKDEAVAIAEEFLPDLMILDVSIPGGGIEAALEITRVFPAMRIMFLTVSDTESDVFSCLQAGALGYVLKGTSGSELLKMAEAVCQGETIITPSLAGRLLTSMHRRTAVKTTRVDQHDLTPRENQILDCVARGLTNKEVAIELELTEKTVKHYMTNIMLKLRVRNRVEATLILRGSARNSLNGADHQ